MQRTIGDITEDSRYKRLFHRSMLLIFLLLLSAVSYASVIGPPGKLSEIRKGDRPKNFEILITEKIKKYKIQFTEKVDGLRTRMPHGYGPGEARIWQPNQYVRIQNIGSTDVVNPRVYANGKGPWKDVHHMIHVAVAGLRTDAEKARSIYEFVKSQRFHATTWDRQASDPVRNFNVYGYTLCNNSADILELLWHHAGIRCRRSPGIAHTMSEAFYDGGYHHFDGDTNSFYLNRDNKTIASRDSILMDHDLIKRTHVDAIDGYDSRRKNEVMAARFIAPGFERDKEIFSIPSTYQVRLRPQESMEWRWDHAGKHYTADLENDLRLWGEGSYAHFCNGKLVYKPDLAANSFLKGLESYQNIRQTQTGGISPVRSTEAAEMIWKVSSSYVLVGSTLNIEWDKKKDDELSADFSKDGQKWKRIFSARDENSTSLSLDSKLSLPNQPSFVFYVRLTLRAKDSPGSLILKKIEFDTDFQHSPFTIPELISGSNALYYADDNVSERKVLIQHSWIERPNWNPPKAPIPAFPRSNQTIEGTDVKLTWHAPPDSEPMRDYHIQLSDRRDMRWTLSPNFDKLVSRTSSTGRTEWRVPHTGLLNPDETYYWRIRGLDKTGVWSDWSEVVSFRCAAPGIPLNINMELVRQKAGFRMPFLSAIFQTKEKFQPPKAVLKWETNPKGRRPMKYRIYGSNEKGFTAGIDQSNTSVPKQNFTAVTETTANSIAIVGSDLTNAIANRAYYRVSAVDEKGNESIHSDLITVPTPLIYTAPPQEAQMGLKYSYQIRSIQSAGGLACGPKCKDTYWNAEQIKFSLIDAPAWLKIDSASGLLKGIADSHGNFKISLIAENASGLQDKQEFYLKITN